MDAWNATARAMTALLVGLLVIVPTVQAQGGLLVERAALDDALTHSEQARMLHWGTLGGREALEALAITASHAEVHVFEYSTYEAGDADTPFTGEYLVKTPYMGENADHRVIRTTNATFRLADAQDEFTMNAYSDRNMDLTSSSGDLEIRPIRDPFLFVTGIEGDKPIAEDDGHQETFSARSLQGDWLLARMSTDADLRVGGDIVLEIRGVTLTLEGDDADGIIYSGIQRKGLGTPVDNQAHERVDTFVRILLTGAVLDVRVDGGAAQTQWVVAEAEAEVQGGAWLYQGARIEMLPEASRLTLSVEGDRMAASWIDQEEESHGAATVASRGAWTWVLFFGFLTFLSLAVTLLLAARVLRQTPSMEAVEEAMEAGSFRRAATLAGRIARRRPNMEEAVLGRAIALARSGRNAAVAEEVGTYVAERDPSDGTLHYVLGLAYLDLGRHADGARALQEAARRTPDLAPEVGKRLGIAEPASPEVSGYV